MVTSTFKKVFMSASKSTLDADFDDKQKLLLPTLYFCLLFFFFYYLLLIIPRFGIDSTIFLVDNIGGLFIVSGFIAAHLLAKKIRNHFVLMLPSYMTLATASLFLAHDEFYANVPHLWLSAQIIGIVFSTYLGTPRWNLVFFILNVTLIPIVAATQSHVVVTEIVHKQAIVYFSSLISVFLSYRFLVKKSELIEARDQALKAENIKSEFLANMSHEIRTPMNGVVGTLQILQRQHLDDTQSDLVERGLLSSRSLLSIINDILDFSKMESGKMDLQPMAIDVAELIEESVAEILPLAEKKNLQTSLEIEADFHNGWMVDPVRLKQIMFNLLSNAIKFTERGNIRVSLYNNQVGLVIEVEDTGLGMTDSVQQSLFSRFAQGLPQKAGELGGSGLGMSITQQLVKLMSGSINVSSVVDVGTTIKITLPVAKVILQSGDNSNKEVIITPDLSGKTILLAEDNKINQRIFEAMILPTQAKLLMADNGHQAYALFQQHQIDCVFMDIQMPVMNGIESCKKIRQQGSKVPLIAVTANVFHDDVQEYYKAGFDSYLPKPVDLNLLYAHLTELIVR